jgi:Ca2+-transporting ATPase
MHIGEYWAESADLVRKRFRSSDEGLRDEEVERRFSDYGENELPHEKSHSDARLLFEQFASPLVILLIAAFLLSLYLGHFSDAVFIAIFVVLNAGVGFYQERKAEHALAALRRLVKISAKVIRGGRRKEVDSRNLVPGDIIELSGGDKVPADARVLFAKDLRVDESALTGEWLAVEKSPEPSHRGAALAERSSALYMGTIVEGGMGRAVVVATASETEIGKIALSLRDQRRHKTPLQRSVASLARYSGLGIVCLLLLIVFVGEVRGFDIGETFVSAVALAVSAIPAGLLPAVTVILSLGMRRILRKNALVRHLVAGETLGSVSVICTDKTGTLTQAKMAIGRIVSGLELAGAQASDEKTLEEARLLALRAAVLGTEGYIENPDDEIHKWIVRGRPTERALVLAAEEVGITRAGLEQELPVRERMSFSSDAKFSVLVREIIQTERELFVVGAPEIIIDRSKDLDIFGKTLPLEGDVRHGLWQTLDSLASEGLRVVAVASRRIHGSDQGTPEQLAKHLTLIAFIALKDPVRPDAKEAVETVTRAGIRTLIVTGDHPLTARAIAKEVGLPSREQDVIVGAQIEKLDDEALFAAARHVSIYARVSPIHKLRIVTALQRHGSIVAVVGDGINDAPALKAADVGIAIGSGTDLAKDVADMILLDDNFKSIGRAVREGRLMFQNIRKVFAYLIGDDLSELSIFLWAVCFNLPLPLLPAQILWINLVEDGLPVFGLSLEEEEGSLMRVPPRSIHEGLAGRTLTLWLVSIFFITSIIAVGFYLFALSIGTLVWARSMMFGLFCFDSLIFSFSARSFEKPLFHRGMFRNRMLTLSLVVGVLFTLLGLYLPPFQFLLSTVPLSLADLYIILFVTAIEIGLIEICKRTFFSRR